MATVYGYARVSSRDQNLNRQLDALGAYGVGSANIYADHASGKGLRSTALSRAAARPGRRGRTGGAFYRPTGRNYSERFLREWRRITKELGSIVVLDMPFA